MLKLDNCILKGARVIDPANKVDAVKDIGISNGRIVEADSLKKPKKIKLENLVLCPGFIDLHVHLRQPGDTDKEDIESGTKAAAAGGFTTVVAMPNTNPPADSPGAIEFLGKLVRENAVVKVLPTATLTVGSEGEKMSCIGSLKKAGVVALTDDGRCIQNHKIMRYVMQYARSFDLPILDHCEDDLLSGKGVMHEGYWSTVLGFPGLPAASEELMVARDIIFAEMVRAKIHIQHVSCIGSLRRIREAVRRKLPVSGEITPHHLALTDEEIKHFDSNFKMKPPLRSEEHRKALIQGIKSGIINVIASDHAPHTETEKLVEFDRAPFGVTGLETAVPVTLTELVHKKHIDLPRLVECFTSGPASVLGMDIGTLRPGSPADITLLDPDAGHTVDKAKFLSKSQNTPFDGYKAKGKAVASIVNGRVVSSSISEFF